MHLNIKSDQAHALAVKLARLTGESISKAVTRAIELQLEREIRARHRSILTEELLEIGKRCARHTRSTTQSHGDLLYDEQGLPK